MRAAVMVLVVMLVGCGEAPKPARVVPDNSSSVYMAAVSGDGLAVGVGTRGLKVNDRGRVSDIAIDGVVVSLETDDAGVWVVANTEAMYVTRDGVKRFPLEAWSSTVLPAGGASAYLVVDGELVFVGDGAAGPARRRVWRGDGHDFDEGAPGGDYGIHHFDR